MVGFFPLSNNTKRPRPQRKGGTLDGLLLNISAASERLLSQTEERGGESRCSDGFQLSCGRFLPQGTVASPLDNPTCPSRRSPEQDRDPGLPPAGPAEMLQR